MKNCEIRTAAQKAGVRLWQVAEEYGVNDGNFSRKLRKELPKEEKEKIMGIIEQLAKENQEGGLMADVVTIREAVQRSKAEGLPVSEYTLRRIIRSGKVPVRQVGQKMLLYYPNLVRYLTCADGADNTPSVAVPLGVRRVDL